MAQPVWGPKWFYIDHSNFFSFLSHLLVEEIVPDSECVVLVPHEKGQEWRKERKKEKKVCDRIAD